MTDIVTIQLYLKTLRMNDAIEKMIIGHGISSPGEVRTIVWGCGGGGARGPLDLICSQALRKSVTIIPESGRDHAPPTSTRPIPLSALRHQQQRIGLFVPR
jgi:hypothetical protein